MSTHQAYSPLPGLRILVVEDWLMIARELESMFSQLQCEVVGPVGDLERAMALAQREELDGAILDVDLNGKTVFPLAEELRRRRVPFIFSTGYDTEHILPEDYRDCLCLEKPFSLEELAAAAHRAFQDGPRRGKDSAP